MPSARSWIAAGLMALVVDASAPAATRPAPRTHTVTIDASSFKPETLTIAVGDSVVWTNRDIIPHTATSKAAGFDSGRLDEGKSWKFTATKKGQFPYICSYHPTMTGEVRVR
jgi:plastocyanin